MGNDALLKALANPADVKYAYSADIEALVDEFPQSGIFRALLAVSGGQQNIQHAAAHFNSAALYKILNSPEELAEISASQIAWVDKPIPAFSSHAANENEYNPFAEIVDQHVHHEPETVIEAEPAHHAVAPEEDVKQDIAATEIEPVQVAEQQYQEPEPIVQQAPPEPAPISQPTPQYFAPAAPVQHHIDDEVYDEIVSIEDISLEQLAYYNTENTQAVTEERQHSIPADGHFAFDGRAIKSEEIAQPSPATAEPVVNEKHDLSKYNDEKLPYTFMWWLDKTRREHAAMYQPYVYNNTGGTNSSKKAEAQPQPAPAKKAAPDELQQQYVENIFNVNAIDQLERSMPENTASHFGDKRGDKIINRFIQTEPHIKHPNNIKLDNENKAKRSSEDANEFVTETLARIYTEQMLYQKAILTYKKLMLKFPEKSLYFASQIQQLEKKPN